MKDIEFYYDKRSKSYDETFGTLYFRVYDAVTWRYLEPYVPTNPNALVLDAGGGTGRWAIRMAEKGCRVVLMDASAGMLRVAEEKAKVHGFQDRVSVKIGDITKIDYADESFDMILCEHALFLFEEPDAVVRELQRVLKKNAPLVISAQNRYVQSLSALSEKPNGDNIDRVLKLLFSEEHERMTKDGEVKVYTWTPEEFHETLERNGLHVEKMIGKLATMPLRIKHETYLKKKCPEDLFSKILQLELALCEKPDALALAGHLHAIAFKL